MRIRRVGTVVEPLGFVWTEKIRQEGLGTLEAPRRVVHKHVPDGVRHVSQAEVSVPAHVRVQVETNHFIYHYNISI